MIGGSRLVRAIRSLGILGLVVALSGLGVLVNLGVPAYRLLRLELRADAVLAEVSRVQEAALAYRQAEGRWPPERPAGHVPPGLDSYLEGEPQWRQLDVVYDWENWLEPDGSPRRPETGIGVGVSVRTADPRLVLLLERRAASRTHAVWGFGVTIATPTPGDDPTTGPPTR